MLPLILSAPLRSRFDPLKFSRPKREKEKLESTVAFLGTGAFGAVTLQHLLNNKVYVAMARSNHKDQISDICDKYNIDHRNSGSRDIHLELRDFNVDIVVTNMFEQLSQKAIREFDCIGIHPSAVPKYRGGCPIEHQIADGTLSEQKYIDLSVLQLSPQLDKGKILHQTQVHLTKEEANVTYKTLRKIAGPVANALYQAMLAIENGNPTLTPQEGRASYAKAIKFPDRFDFLRMRANDIIPYIKVWGPAGAFPIC